MLRLFDGFTKILLMFVLFFLFFSFLGGIAWLIEHTVWLNIIWAGPLFLGMCYMMGEDQGD